jgi:hypothetical protein
VGDCQRESHRSLKATATDTIIGCDCSYRLFTSPTQKA